MRLNAAHSNLPCLDEQTIVKEGGYCLSISRKINCLVSISTNLVLRSLQLPLCRDRDEQERWKYNSILSFSAASQ